MGYAYCKLSCYQKIEYWIVFRVLSSVCEVDSKWKARPVFFLLWKDNVGIFAKFSYLAVQKVYQLSASVDNSNISISVFDQTINNLIITHCIEFGDLLQRITHSVCTYLKTIWSGFL